jgi:hypothetical protein
MVSVSPCDISQHEKSVEVTDLLFFDQYTLLLVDLYKN